MDAGSHDFLAAGFAAGFRAAGFATVFFFAGDLAAGFRAAGFFAGGAAAASNGAAVSCQAAAPAWLDAESWKFSEERVGASRAHVAALPSIGCPLARPACAVATQAATV